MFEICGPMGRVIASGPVSWEGCVDSTVFAKLIHELELEAIDDSDRYHCRFKNTKTTSSQVLSLSLRFHAIMVTVNNGVLLRTRWNKRNK